MLKKIIISLLISYFVITSPIQEFSFEDEYVQENILNSHHALDQELEILKNEPFIAISLGENCFFANHLKEHGIRIRSFPFDWDITSFSALYEIIKNDFKGLLNLKNLAIIKQENTVYNTLYGIKLNHDFDIKDWYDSPEGLKPKDDIGVKKYHNTLAYYQRRIARFYGVMTLNIPIYFFRRVIQSHEARLLHALLKNKFPQTPFKLVCIQDKDLEPIEHWADMPPEISFYQSTNIISYIFETKNPLATNIFKHLNLIQ